MSPRDDTHAEPSEEGGDQAWLLREGAEEDFTRELNRFPTRLEQCMEATPEQRRLATAEERIFYHRLRRRHLYDLAQERQRNNVDEPG